MKKITLILVLNALTISFIIAQTQEQDLNMGLYQIQFQSASGGSNRIQSYGGSYPGKWLFKSRFDNIYIDAGENESNRYNIFFLTGGIERAVLNNNGNFGIGTSDPVSRLEINGDISLDRNHKIKFLTAVGGEDRAFIRSTNGENGDYNSLIFAVGGGNESMIIKANDGNVGIGTNNPGIWKLAVNGSIRAKEIKVETDWSDFVFDDEYRLPTLEDVEIYINKNGHLKNIPSAQEVEKNGILLGEMDSKLLQKIEELTLYTIEQEKRINEQEEKLRILEKMIEELKIVK